MKKNKLVIFLLFSVFVFMACTPRVQETEISPDEIMAADFWKDTYSNEYESYLKNAEMESTTFGGSVPVDYLELYPNLKTLYAGMGFSKEYLRARGHVYSLEDVIHTARPKPGASCLSCKTADYLELINEYGKAVHAMDFDEIAAQVTNSISCYDCHQNTPGEVVLTRSHLTEALEKVEMDFNMGDLVCAQCHIEYYMDPETKEVVVPWENGITLAGIEKAYDDAGYSDWIHPTTGTPLIKIQHPEFETYQGSLHSKMGLSCIDCHMPEVKNDAGELYRSHHWTSPLKNIEASCLTCHSESAEELVTRVEEIQQSVEDRTNEVSDIIVELIHQLETAVEGDQYTEAQLDEIRDCHRKAQLRWDFVFVENSTGFHNPEFTHQTLDEAQMYAERGLELLKEYQ